MFLFKITRVQLQAENVCRCKFLRYIVFSDECVFHVSRIANNQNTGIWGTGNPPSVQEHKSHSEKIEIWCAVHSERVLDSYYFYNETVIKEREKRI